MAPGDEPIDVHIGHGLAPSDRLAVCWVLPIMSHQGVLLSGKEGTEREEIKTGHLQGPHGRLIYIVAPSGMEGMGEDAEHG